MEGLREIQEVSHSERAVGFDENDRNEGGRAGLARWMGEQSFSSRFSCFLASPHIPYPIYSSTNSTVLISINLPSFPLPMDSHLHSPSFGNFRSSQLVVPAWPKHGNLLFYVAWVRQDLCFSVKGNLHQETWENGREITNSNNNKNDTFLQRKFSECRFFM